MNSITSNTKEMPPAPIIRPKTSKDARLMAGFMLVIAVYLVIALALPLYAMLSKSFTTAAFDLENFEFQVNTGDGWGEVISAFQINETLKLLKPEELVTSTDGRLYATTFFPDFNFRSETEYRLRQLDENG
ncbi:MAG: putative 2-aminoethylphosphonate ABC transporter permease subunit, partial [Deltaproteobacteria bacterium]|nr:putative 2-aminoethylphosphonate ABC transporter permease subunit [Deltaproteobacteria bacterium]